MILLGIGLLLVAGCGPGKGTPVSGTLVLPDGIQLADNDGVDLTFAPQDPNIKKGGKGIVKPADKTFTANSVETTGLLPGQYKITVRITPYQGMPDSAKRGVALEPLNKKYGELEKTPLTIDIPPGPAPVSITIDLAKGTATKS